MRAPFLFIAFICLLVPFTSPGSPHPYLGQIGISSQGINLAILICLKCAGLFAVFSAFVSPLSSSDLGAALAKLHCPWQLAAMLVLMDMNIHIIQREWERLKTAADLRGFSAVTNMHSYRTLAAMLALWLIRAAERAKTTHEGMLLRGFDGHFPITQSASPSRGDRIFAVITILMAFGLLALNILWTYQL